MRKLHSPLLLLGLCVSLILISLSVPAGSGTIARGAMLHARQILERYDTSGEPLLQYLESWMDASRVTQRELKEDGRTLSYAYSDGTAHLVWDAETLKAEKLAESRVFLPDYAAFKAGFSAETALSGQTYAGRPCTAILLEDPENDEDWLKIYLDDETGFVLFCEAPLFRLRTSSLETLPLDESRLTPPDGLLF